jgi:pyruvate/2-oxoglutarate/acetoin dehydrogenase E1 component
MQLSYHEARTRAIARELEANPELLVLGGSLSAPFNPDDGIARNFSDHVLQPPISEFATLSVGVGAAMAGMRTLVPVSTASFMFYGWSAVVLEAANVRYLSGGLSQAPIAVHVMAGSRRSGGAQHEHTPQAMLQNVPGLRVYAPGTPAEIDSVLHAALTGGDPCVIADHVLLADATGSVGEAPAAMDMSLLREGGDGLIVSYSALVQRALSAAGTLAGQGIEIAVLSVPCLNPLPEAELLAHVSAHDAVLFVDESRAAGSPASHMLARAVDAGFEGRAGLLCSGPAPAPFATRLLDELVPTAARIERAMRELLERQPITRPAGGTRA